MLHSDTSGLPTHPNEQKKFCACALVMHFSCGVAVELAQDVNPATAVHTIRTVRIARSRRSFMELKKRVKFNVVFILPHRHPLGNEQEFETGTPHWLKDIRA
jgi:hypothetical protein